MMVNHQNTVDGCEILHQLKTVVYPIIYRVSTIQGGAGFLPSTVAMDNETFVDHVNDN